jgi:hypothetical protein
MSSTIDDSNNVIINIPARRKKYLAKGQWRKKYDEAPGNGWSQETILLVEAWMRRAAHMEKSYVQKELP